VVESDGEGTDQVNSSVAFSLAGQYIERLTLTGSATSTAPATRSTTSSHGNAGNNVLNGRRARIPWPRRRQRHYTVDNAGDTVIESSGQGTDQVNSSVSFDLAGQYIERLTLTGSGNINGAGNSLPTP
jgi:hypothetical protein